MKTKILVFVITLFLLFSGIQVAIGSEVTDGEESIEEDNEFSKTLSTDGDYEVREPIKIYNNTDFAEQADANNWTGNGSEENPYIIEGYEINAEGEDYCINISNTDVHFELRNNYLYWASNAGIHLDSVQNGTVTECDIQDNDGDGIRIGVSSHNTILGNSIIDNDGDGIFVYRTNRLIIGDNTIKYNSNNVYFSMYTDNSTIVNNEMSKAGTDIHFDHYNENNTILKNELSSSGSIYLCCYNINTTIIDNKISDSLSYKSAITITITNENTTVINNTLLDNSVGILLEECNGNIIINNTIKQIDAPYGTTKGIEIVSSDNNVIVNNTISQNDIGITLEDSYNNLIYHNTFIENGQQAEDNRDNEWDAGDPAKGGKGGNYWSDYEGQDRGDGIGDEPYEIAEGDNQDNYPWMNPQLIRFNVTPSQNQTVGAGETLDFSAEAYDRHGNMLTDNVTDFTWQNATDGVFYKESAGVYNVRATYRGASSVSTSVTVEPVGLDYILINPGKDQTIKVGEFINFTGKPYDKYDNLIEDKVNNYTWTIEGTEYYGEVINHTFNQLGEYTVELNVTDDAGNYDTDTVKVTVKDVTPPTVEIENPTSKTYSKSSLEISAIVNDEANPIDSVFAEIDGTENVSLELEDSSYVTTYSFSDGHHTIQIYANDTAGNWNSQTVSFTVDTTPPSVTITNPNSDEKLYTLNKTVEWEGNDNIEIDHYELRIDDGPWMNTNSRSYAFSDLSEGNHTVEVKAIDGGGNTGSDTVTLTVVYPELKLNLSSTAIQVGETITISGNLTWGPKDMSGKTLEFSTDVTGHVATIQTDEGGVYSFEWQLPVSGEYNLTASWNQFEEDVSIGVATTTNDQAFTVVSSSVLKQLSFNENSKVLTFTVSGEDGTTGYVDVTIAKSIVSNATDIEVRMDGNVVNYNITSQGDAWLLHFSYTHSSHSVDINLPEEQDSNGDGVGAPRSTTMILLLTAVILAMVTAVAIYYKKKR